MPCGCGRSYIVNENLGFSNRRKKDTSFRSFITFLLLVLLLWIAIYCIILTANQGKGEKSQQYNISKDNLQGEIEHARTKNASIFNKNTTNQYDVSSNQTDQTETTGVSLEILHNEVNKEVINNRNNQFAASTSNQIDTTPKSIDDIVKLFPDLETSLTKATELVTFDFKAVTTQTYPSNIVSDIIAIVSVDINTELNQENTSQNNMAEEETDTNSIFKMDTSNNKTLSSQNKSKDILKLDTEENTIITALFTNIVKSTTESNKEDFMTESNELFSDHNNIFSNTENLTNDDTTETLVAGQVTNWVIRKDAFEKRKVEESEPNSQFSTEDNVSVTMVALSERELINKETPSQNLTSIDNNEIKVEQTSSPYFINNVVTDSKTTTSRNLFDATSRRFTGKQRSKADTVQINVQKFTEDESEDGNVCTAPSCKEKAGQILQLMDPSFDPCEDFYQFSCGGVKNVDQIYTDVLLKHVFTFYNPKDKYLKSFRKFFNSCIKYETEYGYSTKIKQVLSSTVRDSNLTSLLAFLMLRQSTPLFEVRYGFVGGEEGYGLQIFPPHSNYGTIGLKGWSLQSQIEKGCLNLNPKLKYESDVDLRAVYEDYNKCKEATFKRMAENFVAEKLDRTRVPNKIILKEFLSFFSKMNTVSGSVLQHAILNQEYSKTNMEILSRIYPEISWQDFFKIITGKTVEISTPIYLYLEQEYFLQIMSDLKERMLKTEKEVIETLKLYYQLELYQNVMTPKQSKEKFCLNQAIELMPEIAIKIFDEISGEYSEFKNIFSELKEKFYGLIDSSHLEQVNKKKYKNNLEKLTLKLFEDTGEWDKYLDMSYASFYLTDDYLSNVFMFVENKRRSRNGLRIGDDDEWFIFTQFVDSQFESLPKIIPGANVIAIPNKFLYKFHGTQEYPPYIVKSYLKFHLSRALALHFNDIDQKLKSQFYRDFLNSLNTYFNADDIKSLKDQRISYKSKAFWQEIVQFSEGARMADRMALDLAFKDIYTSNETFNSLPWISKEYSPQHQFFILIAQEYCENPTLPALAQHLYESPNIPSSFLVEKVIMNSNAFGETFDCAHGAAMNPEEKTQFETFIPTENNYYEEVNK